MISREFGANLGHGILGEVFVGENKISTLE